MLNPTPTGMRKGAVDGAPHTAPSAESVTSISNSRIWQTNFPDVPWCQAKPSADQRRANQKTNNA